MPTNMTELDIQFILLSLAGNECDERVQAYLDSELVGETDVSACVSGARCWRHRKEDAKFDCGMRIASTRTITSGTRLIIIFDDHIASGKEPEILCGHSLAHNQKHNTATAHFAAIRHSCAKWPEDAWTTTNNRRKLYRIASCGSLQPNLLKAWSRTRGEWETLYKVTDTCFMTADALIVVNNNVWDAFAGTPCMFVPDMCAKSTLFLIAAMRSFVNQGIAASLGYAVRRHEVLKGSMSNTTLQEYAGKKGLTNWTMRTVWRALWRYQYMKSVGMDCFLFFLLIRVNFLEIL